MNLETIQLRELTTLEQREVEGGIAFLIYAALHPATWVYAAGIYYGHQNIK